MQGTVKYSEEFVTPDGRKYWVGHEMQYDQENQDPPFDKCAKAAIAYAAGKSKAYEMLSIAVPEYPPFNAIQVEIDLTEEDRMNSLIEDINNETVLRLPEGGGGLLSWEKMVNTIESKNKTIRPTRIKEAYDKKYAELTQKQ